MSRGAAVAVIIGLLVLLDVVLGASLNLVAPSGTSVFKAYQRQSIEFVASDVPAVTLYYRLSPSDAWQFLDVVQTTEGSNRYTWFLPSDTTAMASTAAALRLEDVMGVVSDVVSSTFTIQAGNAGIVLTSPAARATVRRGALATVSWTYTGVGNVQLSYAKGRNQSSGAFGTWYPLATLDGTVGSYAWNLAQVSSPAGETWEVRDDYYIRASDGVDALVYDQVGPFRVDEEYSLLIPSTAYPRVLVDGVASALSWNTRGALSQVSLAISHGGNATLSSGVVPNAGSFVFQPSLPAPATQLETSPRWDFSVSTPNALVRGESAKFFVSPPKSITVLGFQPNQVYTFYNPVMIVSASWEGIVLNLRVSFSVDGGASFGTYLSGVAVSNATFALQPLVEGLQSSVPLVFDEPLIVRVSDDDDGSVYGQVALVARVYALRPTYPVTLAVPPYLEPTPPEFTVGAVVPLRWDTFPSVALAYFDHVTITVLFFDVARAQAIGDSAAAVASLTLPAFHNNNTYDWPLPVFPFASASGVAKAQFIVRSHPSGQTVGVSSSFIITQPPQPATETPALPAGVVAGIVIGVVLGVAVLLALVLGRRRLMKQCASVCGACTAACTACTDRLCCRRNTIKSHRMKLQDAEAAVEL